MGMRGIVGGLISVRYRSRTGSIRRALRSGEAEFGFVTGASGARKGGHPFATQTPCKLLIFLRVRQGSMRAERGQRYPSYVTEWRHWALVYSGWVSRGWAAFSKNSFCSLRLSWSALTARVAFTIPSIHAFILNSPNS